jgi:alpha-ketoglutarate-dependent 2,4-dichlorophenoxyacetate dioxygenase
VQIRPLHPVFAAEVTGIDLRQPQSEAAIEAIEDAIAQYAVLVLPGQDITDDQQLVFSQSLGPLEETRGSGISKPHEMRLHPAFADISNLNVDNTVLARDNRRRLYSLGNMLWHSDSSFKPIPSTYSLLSARIPVDKGGETQFADMRAAYDSLGPETKAQIEDLVCEHSLLYSRATLGFMDLTEEERATMRPVQQVLVRTHPRSGRKSLYLSSHIGKILGWPTPEAMAFIRDLAEHATQPENVYTHRWRKHDLVMWDNRTTMHRARRYDHTQVRDMRRTTVGDVRPTVAQAEAA